MTDRNLGLVGQRRETFTLDDKVSIEFVYTARPPRLDINWYPDLPSRRWFKRGGLERYRDARDAFLGMLANEIGGNILVVEP